MDARYSIDGPHTPGLVLSAADDLAELVRYLNHATLANRAGDSLPDPNTVARLLGALGTALEHLPQLLNQVNGRIDHLDDVGILRASEGTARLAAANVESKLTIAAAMARDAAVYVAKARTYADRLYLDGDDRD